jgi:hypothetical protein
MEQHAGIDGSLEWSSVCIVDASGRIVREIKVASEPEGSSSFKGLASRLRGSGSKRGRCLSGCTPA